MEDKKIIEKIEKYKQLTKQALNEIQIRENLSNEEIRIAEQFIEFAKNYFNDAEYFKNKGLLLESLAALSYAHAWLDAGIKAKLLVGKNTKLFAGI